MARQPGQRTVQLTCLMDYELTLADQAVSIKIRALKAVIMDLTLRHRNILSSDRPAEANDHGNSGLGGNSGRGNSGQW